MRITWPKFFEDSKETIEEVVNYLRRKHDYEVKKHEKRKQTQFHNFVKKSELYQDVLTNCVNARSGRGIVSQAIIGNSR